MRNLVLALLGALILPFTAAAQMRIDVSGVGATQYPIAVARFASDGRAPQDVAAVVRGDLTRSGAFRVIEPRRPSPTPARSISSTCAARAPTPC